MIINKKQVNLGDYKKQEKLNVKAQKTPSPKLKTQLTNNKKFPLIDVICIVAFVILVIGIAFPIVENRIKQINLLRETEVIRQINNALQEDCKENGIERHTSMYEAVIACRSRGFYPDAICATNDQPIAWDSSNDCFVNIDLKNNTVEYVSLNKKGNVQLDEYKVDMTNGSEYRASRYYVTFTKENFVENTPYSVYAYNDEKSWDRSVKICSNFDAGESFGITGITINYIQNRSAKTYKIRTNSFTTTITAKLDNTSSLYHYGIAGAITISNCNKWYECGLVGKINIEEGNLLISTNVTIYQINHSDFKKVKISGSSNSNIYDSTGKKITMLNMLNSENEKSLEVDEFTCTHDLYEDISELVNGNYVICKKCGNTLIQVEDEEKNITYNSVFNSAKTPQAYIIETGTYKYNELPIENCNVWPLNKILSCKHDYVLENCVREVNSTVDICESLVTDYFKCSKCEKEIVKEHQTGHLLNSDQTHCSREEYGCTYNLEHEGYTNIININNSKYVLNTDELYSKPSIIQENNSYYLCFSKGLESTNDSINVYRLTFKDNTIYVYAEIVKSETPDNIETIKSIKIKNYNGATNGTNNVAINNETKIVVIYK